MVPSNYIYFLDEKGLFEEGGEGVKNEELKVKCEVKNTKKASPERLRQDPALRVQNEGKGDNVHSFKGIPLKRIATEWLMATGGEPVEGERNTRLHALAYDMRYITDFNEATLLSVMPNYGLGEEEMKGLIHSACIAPRSKGIPKNLKQVMRKLQQPEQDDDGEESNFPTAFNYQSYIIDFPLPPLIKQIVAIAPADFKNACILCQLPMLGTLASKLRAMYLDGCMQSPSFQVSLEAPQASGKSFMTRMARIIMVPILERDEEERQKEVKYNDRVAELKVTGIKVTLENKDELLGQRPKGIIRIVSPKISITKLLQRLDNARGLHLFALAPEIDTVTNAFKRSFSSYGDLLRVAFDNDLYGQDYASAESFSGLVPVYYNTLFSGTPKAMRRFYPDVEDGLVSRVCFVALPDQFGKPMPVWGKLKEKDMKEIKLQLERLDRVSVVGNTVQPDYVMDMDFLNEDLNQWLSEQQKEAVRTNDRTRDVFCRRAAVVGFRAGMLAWFLYGEKPAFRKRTIAFARWVANQMLTQHLLRFEINGTSSNVNRWEDAYNMLKEEFTRDELEQALYATGSTVAVKQVVYRWKLLGCIETVEEGAASSGNRMSVRFKKVKP
jgi:hypothetical protein